VWYRGTTDTARESRGIALSTENEDWFCLRCLHSLKGLPGDPVRCPECGELSWADDLRIATSKIESRMRVAETLLSLCVLGMWATVLGAAAFCFFPAAGGPVLLGGLLIWGVSLRGFARLIRHAKGLGSAIWWYHFTGLVWLVVLLAIAGAALLIYDTMSARSRWWLQTTILAGGVAVACLGRATGTRFLAWPYRTARDRLRTLCLREVVQEGRLPRAEQPSSP